MRITKSTILLLLITLLIKTASTQSLHSELTKIVKNHELLGGQLVIFDGQKIIENLSFGYANYDSKTKVDHLTKFRVASISKFTTAIAVMQLIEKNLIRLNDDINKLLGLSIANPKFPNTSITIRMLLSHTSSIYDGSNYDKFLTVTYNNETIPNINELLIVDGRYYSDDFFLEQKPGSFFNYSNINYGLLGTIVEKVSGQRFDKYCKEKIFDRLGVDASYNINDLKNINQLAVLYRKQNNKWTSQTDDFNGIYPDNTRLNNYEIGSNAFVFGPQGGVRISASDLSFLFAELLGTEKLLCYESYKTMRKNAWNYNGTNGNDLNGVFRSWGLGIHRITNTEDCDKIFKNSGEIYGLSGDAYGLIGNAYVDIKNNIGFIFLMNGTGKGLSKGKYSGFYSLEEDIFKIIETYLMQKGLI